jgi:hypothetical protein
MKIYDWGLPEAEEDVDEPIPTEELKEEDNEISESKSSFHQIAIIRNLIVILNTSGHLIVDFILIYLIPFRLFFLKIINCMNKTLKIYANLSKYYFEL